MACGLAERAARALRMFWVFATARCMPSATAFAAVPVCMEDGRGTWLEAVGICKTPDGFVPATCAGAAEAWEAAMGCVDANAAPCVLSAAGAAAEGVVTEADMGCAEEPEEALCWPAAELAPEGCCSEGSMVHCGVSACATPA